MKNLKPVVSILFMALSAMLVSALFAFNPFTVFIVLLASSFFLPRKVSFMAIQREIWERDIVGNLFKNNDFAKRAFSADQYVTMGKVVHIPYAGAPSTVNKNNNTFPVVAVNRGDVDVTYSIDTFQTVPRRIANIDKYELSYDKRQSVIAEDQAQLIQVAMDGLLYNWAPAASNTFLTAGPVTTATLPGATGNRLSFDKTAFGSAKLRMDRANIDPNNRVALLTADHHQQLINSFTDAEKTGFYASVDMKRGVVGRYLNFDVMLRSSVLRYRQVGTTPPVWTPVDEYAASFPTDNQTADSAASLFYSDYSVERAFGGVTMFDNTMRAEYYGDIISFELRMGGRIRRNPGVWAVIEAPSA
ncbi:MAG: hypothetical protein EKK39_14885 [Sphingobacteriales bacterium]|nr:MAG: hypothetical protein EKK39_14885 [Sphingobacteriales bacterium]